MASCKTVEKFGEVIHGKFRECIVKPKSHFAKASYRWVRVTKKGAKKKPDGAAAKRWILVGCPIKKWKKGKGGGKFAKGKCTGARETHAKLTKIGRGK